MEKRATSFMHQVSLNYYNRNQNFRKYGQMELAYIKKPEVKEMGLIENIDDWMNKFYLR